MDPALRELLRLGQAETDQVLEAIIRLRRPGLEVPGVRIVSRFGTMATCRLPLGLVPSVHDHPDVRSLKASRQMAPQSGVRGPTGSADPGGAGGRRNGRFQRQVGGPLTGAGVVVGVVDWGLDVDHPNFKTDDGSTRLLALWDQRSDSTARAPQPYGYGTVHLRPEIDEALAGPTPYRSLGYDPADADRHGGSHGTHVTDIAAGNGRAGGPIGVAREAELVFVHLADRAIRGLATLGDSVRLLEAVDFVARTAGDKPWVANLSVGQTGGPHDGTLAVERAFDELLATTPGAFIVQSAGNYERARTHASGTLRPGQRRTLTFIIEPTDSTANELEIWYDGDDELVVHLQPPGREAATAVHLGADAPISAGGRWVGWVYHRACDPNNGDHHIDAFLSPRAPAGAWRVTLEAVRARSGRFHAWIERDDSCVGCQPRFAPADSDPHRHPGDDRHRPAAPHRGRLRRPPPRPPGRAVQQRRPHPRRTRQARPGRTRRWRAGCPVGSSGQPPQPRPTHPQVGHEHGRPSRHRRRGPVPAGRRSAAGRGGHPPAHPGQRRPAPLPPGPRPARPWLPRPPHPDRRSRRRLIRPLPLRPQGHRHERRP